MNEKILYRYKATLIRLTFLNLKVFILRFFEFRLQQVILIKRNARSRDTRSEI